MTTGMSGPSTNPSLKPQTRVYFIFDKTSGEILHVHRSVIFPHGREDDTVARLLAKMSANADVLEAEEKVANRMKPLRVDVDTRRLVEK